MKNLAAIFTDLIAKGADISAIATCLECSPSVAGICLTAGAVGLSVAQHLQARKAEQSEKQRDEEILALITRLAEQAHNGDTAILTLVATDRQAHKAAYEKFAREQRVAVGDIHIDDLRRPHEILQRFLVGIAIDAEGARIAAESADAAIAISNIKLDRIESKLHPATTPRIPWNIPESADQLFGRDADIAAVSALTLHHRIVFITGPGGLGKTALAAAVITHIVGRSDAPIRFTGGILKHDFYTSPSHLAALQSILSQTGQDSGKADDAARAAAQLAVPHRLLYLEGCEMADDLSALLAIAPSITILATSRNSYQTDSAAEHPLAPITDDSAADLIHHHWKHGNARQCLDLAKMLGGHGLACERAGIQLKEGRRTPAVLRQKLLDLGLAAIHPKPEHTGGRDRQHKAIGFLLQMDAAAVAEKNKHALRVWSLLAFHALSPLPIDPLPEREKIAENPADQPALLPGIIADVLQISEDEADSALDALRARSLVKVELLPVHHDGSEERHARLTHALLSEHARPYASQFPYAFPLPEKAAIHLASRAIEWWEDTINRWSLPGPMPGRITRYTLLAPQFDQLPNRAEAALAHREGGRPGPDNPKEVSDPAQSPQSAPDFPAGKQGAGTAPLPPLTHSTLIHLIANLGYLEYTLGHYAKAEPLYERALEALERTLGREHQYTLGSVNNLAALYIDQAAYAKAEPLYERLLEAVGRTLGREHPHTLASVNNLAFLNYNQGDYAKAEQLFVRVLEASERTLGREHPDTLLSVNNLAGLYYNQAAYAKAEPLYVRALDAQERTLGREHQHTLISVNNLAELYRNNGDYAKAEPLLLRALEARERTLGHEHPHTLNSMNNLAGFLYERGRSAEGLPLIIRAVEGYERVLGPQHPTTIVSRKWLDHIRKAVEWGGPA